MPVCRSQDKYLKLSPCGDDLTAFAAREAIRLFASIIKPIQPLLAASLTDQANLEDVPTQLELQL